MKRTDLICVFLDFLSRRRVLKEYFTALVQASDDDDVCHIGSIFALDPGRWIFAAFPWGIYDIDYWYDIHKKWIAVCDSKLNIKTRKN